MLKFCELCKSLQSWNLKTIFFIIFFYKFSQKSFSYTQNCLKVYQLSALKKIRKGCTKKFLKDINNIENMVMNRFLLSIVKSITESEKMRLL